MKIVVRNMKKEDNGTFCPGNSIPALSNLGPDKLSGEERWMNPSWENDERHGFSDI